MIVNMMIMIVNMMIMIVNMMIMVSVIIIMITTITILMIMKNKAPWKPPLLSIDHDCQYDDHDC